MLIAAMVAGGAYRKRLANILRTVHKAYMHVLEPHLKDVAKGGLHEDAAHSAWKKKLDQLDANIKHVREPAGEAFDDMQKKLNAQNFKAAKTLLGMTPTSTRIAEKIAQFRDQNIQLVENAARSYAQDVREVFDDPDNFGLRVEDLKQRLLERGGVSESRADLIARDQTLKLNGQLNMLRQTNAGIEEYIWSTSHDERVRPTHAELDGQRFSWNNPPLVDGEPLNPGDDYNCRCVGLPVIDESEDIE